MRRLLAASALGALLGLFGAAHAQTPGGPILPIQSGLTGQVSVTRGGTGLATLTSQGVLIGNGTSNPIFISEVDGDCLLGSGGAWTTGSCGGGGGSLTVAGSGGGSGSVASVTTLNLSNFVLTGSGGTATGALSSPDRQVASGGTTIGGTSGDIGGQIDSTDSSAQTFTLPSTTVCPAGSGFIVTNQATGLLTVDGGQGLYYWPWQSGGNPVLYQGGSMYIACNGTAGYAGGFPGFGAIGGNITCTAAGVCTLNAVTSVTGTSRVVTTGSIDTLLSTDCGKTVIYNNAGYTVTIPAAIVPASGTTCKIDILTATANKVSVNGSAVSAATLVSADSYTGTQAVAGSAISLQLTTVGAATDAFLFGHGS